MNGLLCVLTALLTVAAYSVSDVNVPAISSGSDRLAGKIVWHELVTDTPAETERFYATLLGWEFRSLPDANINYRMIYNQGRPIGGMIDQTQLATSADISQWVSLLSVYDIAAATDAVANSGGTVYTPPTSLGDRGDIATAASVSPAAIAPGEAAAMAAVSIPASRWADEFYNRVTPVWHWADKAQALTGANASSSAARYCASCNMA
ncbi:VOC family protein [Halioglobus sp. HI00S01]|uniref:VOC family protein n=1 Tax=Halioglobus sp. HI00S01 TaxID=1822214 RepID=UPI0012E82E48|nr:VOC family protein [Halioglobus sp. HI00S01]